MSPVLRQLPANSLAVFTCPGQLADVGDDPFASPDGHFRVAQLGYLQPGRQHLPESGNLIKRGETQLKQAWVEVVARVEVAQEDPQGVFQPRMKEPLGETIARRFDLCFRIARVGTENGVLRMTSRTDDLLNA